MKLKRLAASSAALLLLAGLLSGCGEKQFDSVLTVDGEAVSPAVYRMYQMQAYVQASQRVSSLSDTIGGVTASDWIYDTTVSLLRARRYYELEFDAQGLSFTEDERALLEEQTGSAWASAHAVYEKNGVDEDVYRQYQLCNAKGRKLFEAYCADLTDEQVKAYLEDHFVFIEYTQLPRIDSDGAPLDEEDLRAVDRLAEQALDELAAPGGDAGFVQVCAGAVAASFALGGFTVPDLSSADNFVSSSYLTLDGTGNAFTEALAQKAEAVGVGGFGSYADERVTVLFHRLPNYETEQAFQDLRPSVLATMRGEDFDAACSQVWDAYDVAADEKAVAWYDPRKLDLSAPAPTEAPSSAPLGGE